MGKPAARMGDSLAHGGTIVVGFPTVLIGGMPAARLGDMHVCPMVTPGTPPIPHVGGPITLGSAGVLIGGVPAARLGDMATCVGPPDTIAMGCMTVLIGETGGGGGGGGGGMGAAVQSAVDQLGARGAQGSGASNDSGDDNEAEGHILDISLQDQAGFPIGGVGYGLRAPDGAESGGIVAGRVQQVIPESGQFDFNVKAVTSCAWSARQIQAGDTVQMKVETIGVDDGELAKITILCRERSLGERRIARFEAQVSGNKVEIDHTFEVDDTYLELQREAQSLGRYFVPRWCFEVEVGGLREVSAPLQILATFEIELHDEEGQAMGGVPYRVHFATGEVREGELDDQGQASEENAPAGEAQVRFGARETE